MPLSEPTYATPLETIIDSLCPFGSGAGLPSVPGSGFIPFARGILLNFEDVGVPDEVVAGKFVPQAGRQHTSRSRARHETIDPFLPDVYIAFSPHEIAKQANKGYTIRETQAGGKKFLLNRKRASSYQASAPQADRKGRPYYIRRLYKLCECIAYSRADPCGRPVGRVVKLYLPSKNASRLPAAGLAIARMTCEAKVITITAAAVSEMEALRPMGVARRSSLSGASKYMALMIRP